jgi:hypothetical protein
MINWTAPVIRYACLFGVVISAGFAFGAVFAFAGFIGLVALAFWA